MSVPLTASRTCVGVPRRLTMRVPARPSMMARISSGAPMTPTAPGVLATKSATAATLGSMLPAPNSPAAMKARASSTVMRVEPALLGRAEADRDPRHAGRDEQHVGAEVVGEQARREVLVDDGLDADEAAVGLQRDRDAAAARCDDDRARVEQRADLVGLDDPLRPRRWHRAPPAAAGVLHDGPAEFLGHRAGTRLR